MEEINQLALTIETHFDKMLLLQSNRRKIKIKKSILLQRTTNETTLLLPSISTNLKNDFKTTLKTDSTIQRKSKL